MKIVDLRWEGFKWDVDEQVDAERCAFWQNAEYAPKWNSSIRIDLKVPEEFRTVG